jgi:hypothetical protein
MGAVSALALLAAAPAAGDTAPPQITIAAPAEGAVFDQILHIEASAADADGVGRITFKADGKSIKSFTSGLQGSRAVSLDWRRARELSPGEHTITIEAVDKQGSNPVTHGENLATASIKVRRVPAATLPKAKTKVSAKLTGSGLKRRLSGAVSAPAVGFPREAFPLTGKVHVFWEIFSYGHWKVRHKGVADAAAPFRVSQKLAQKGRWRVHVVYEPKAPYAGSRSSTIAFTA